MSQLRLAGVSARLVFPQISIGYFYDIFIWKGTKSLTKAIEKKAVGFKDGMNGEVIFFLNFHV
jgi:hypothetical protein